MSSSNEDVFMEEEPSTSAPEASGQNQISIGPQGIRSPDKQNARHRLGDLLSGIRTGDINTFSKEDDPDNSNSSNAPKPNHPRDRSSLIKFEVRNKTFHLREKEQTEGMYHLLRSWMNGRLVDEDPVKADSIFSSSPTPPSNSRGSASEESLDLMATKEIRRMPDPLPEEFELPKMAISSHYEHERLGVGANVNDLRKEHLAGWKTARRQHQEYMALREAKYTPSLQLLKTVHDITQQTIE